MRRKDAGFVEKMLPVLLSTGMVFGLILLSGRFTEVIRTREEMNQIARAYLLEMETVGYLPNDRILSLENKLKDCGLTEISFAGTTLTEVDYGESIQLSVTGNLKVNLPYRFCIRNRRIGIFPFTSAWLQQQSIRRQQ